MMIGNGEEGVDLRDIQVVEFIEFDDLINVRYEGRN